MEAKDGSEHAQLKEWNSHEQFISEFQWQGCLTRSAILQLAQLSEPNKCYQDTK